MLIRWLFFSIPILLFKLSNNFLLQDNLMIIFNVNFIRLMLLFEIFSNETVKMAWKGLRSEEKGNCATTHTEICYWTIFPFLAQYVRSSMGNTKIFTLFYTIKKAGNLTLIFFCSKTFCFQLEKCQKTKCLCIQFHMGCDSGLRTLYSGPSPRIVHPKKIQKIATFLLIFCWL